MLRKEKRRIFFSVFGAIAVLGVYSATGKNDSFPAYARKSESKTSNKVTPHHSY